MKTEISVSIPENGTAHSEATINVHTVIVRESYFVKRYFPKILYNEYPKPEPIPSRTALRDNFSPDENAPVTRIRPVNVITSDNSFLTVIFSLNKNRDIIITNIGAVYKSNAGTDAPPINSIDSK